MNAGPRPGTLISTLERCRAKPGQPPPDGPFAHVLATYRDEAAFLEMACRFVDNGLRADETVAVAAAPARLRALTERLGAEGDRVVGIELLETSNPGTLLPVSIMPLLAEQDRNTGGGRLRVLHDAEWTGGRAVQAEACGRFEALADHVLAGRPMSLVCLYAEGREEPAAEHAAHSHPVVLDGDELRVNLAYDPAWISAVRARPLPPPPSGGVAALRFDQHSQHLVRALTLQVGADRGLTPDRAMDAELAVNELTANSLEHGGGSGLLEIWHDVEEDIVFCQVTDRGHLTDPRAGQVPVGLSTDGGRGLFLVHTLTDLVLVHTRPGRTVVRVGFTVSGDRAARRGR